MKPPSRTERHDPRRAPALAPAHVISCGFVALALLLLLAPPHQGQSGRKRTDPPAPSATPPNGARPRRTNATPAPTPTKPPADQPGAPATPDEPRGTPTPTPAPLTTNDPDTGQPVEIDPDEVVRVNSNLVPIPASVVDDGGRAVINLGVDDFELRVDGQPRPIGDVTRAETPVRLALLFDNSYSLRAARELEKQAAMRFFRTVVRPVDQAAIFSVSTEPILEQPLTPDVNRLVHVIERYGEPEGATALLDTIVQAADYLKPQAGRKVIVIVSDGVDTVSNTDFAETLRRVQAADCQVYAVQNNISENANLRDLTAERRLQELAASTGGAVFAPRNVNDLPGAFAQISADLAQQYVLSYYPSDERRDGRFRIISLRVKTRPNVRVRARRGYYPRQAQQLSATTSYTYDPSAPAVPDPNVAASLGDEQPVAPSPPVTIKTNAPVTGPSYGSKNLNPDDDGTTLRRASAPTDTRALPQREEVARRTEPPRREEAAPPGPTGPPLEADEEATDAPPPSASKPAPANAPANDSNTLASASTRPAADSTRPATDSTRPATDSTRPAPPAPTPASKPNAPKETSANDKPPQTAQAQSAPEATAGTPRPRAPVAGGVLNARALKLPKPFYPETARRMRVVGTVMVEVTIDESGKVITARATTGHSLLREASVSAARQALFTPTLLHDKPVQVTGVIVYNFSQ
jgi:Ca-activated chloride channel family protein